MEEMFSFNVSMYNVKRQKNLPQGVCQLPPFSIVKEQSRAIGGRKKGKRLGGRGGWNKGKKERRRDKVRVGRKEERKKCYRINETIFFLNDKNWSLWSWMNVIHKCNSKKCDCHTWLKCEHFKINDFGCRWIILFVNRIACTMLLAKFIHFVHEWNWSQKWHCVTHVKRITWINLIFQNEIEHKGKPNTYADKYDIYMVTKWWNFTM